MNCGHTILKKNPKQIALSVRYQTVNFLHRPLIEKIRPLIQTLVCASGVLNAAQHTKCQNPRCAITLLFSAPLASLFGRLAFREPMTVFWRGATTQHPRLSLALDVIRRTQFHPKSGLPRAQDVVPNWTVKIRRASKPYTLPKPPCIVRPKPFYRGGGVHLLAMWWGVGLLEGRSFA